MLFLLLSLLISTITSNPNEPLGSYENDNVIERIGFPNTRKSSLDVDFQLGFNASSDTKESVIQAASVTNATCGSGLVETLLFVGVWVFGLLAYGCFGMYVCARVLFQIQGFIVGFMRLCIVFSYSFVSDL